MRSIPPEILDPTFMRKPADLQYFLLAMLKGGLDKRSRDLIGSQAAKFINLRAGNHIYGSSQPKLNAKGEETVATLRQKGISFIDPVFTAEDLRNISQYMEGKQIYFSEHGSSESNKKRCTINERPLTAEFGHYSKRDILSCSPIYHLIHNQRLIETLASYLMAPPTISMVEMWWSFPMVRPPTGMQLFHHDRGDFRSCNLFVYLSEVSELTGPHSFVERTHEFNVLYPLIEERYGHDPGTVNDFWNWMELHRKNDEDMHKYFHEDEIKILTGAEGTSFLEDTRGLHKATIPILGPRLAFEIVYTVLPKYNEAIDPIRRSELNFEGVQKNYEEIDPLIKYATRLIYQ